MPLYDTKLAPSGWPETLRTSARLPAITVHSDESLLRARRITTHLIDVIGQLGWRFVAKVPDPPEQHHYRRTYESPEEAERRAAQFLVEDERQNRPLRENILLQMVRTMNTPKQWDDRLHDYVWKGCTSFQTQDALSDIV